MTTELPFCHILIKPLSLWGAILVIIDTGFRGVSHFMTTDEGQKYLDCVFRQNVVRQLQVALA